MTASSSSGCVTRTPPGSGCAQLAGGRLRSAPLRARRPRPPRRPKPSARWNTVRCSDSGTPGATWMAAPARATRRRRVRNRAAADTVGGSQVVRLPRIPMRFPMYLPGPTGSWSPRGAARGGHRATDTPLGELTVGNTHLSFVPGWNRRQLRRLVHDLRGLPGRDFDQRLNMTPTAVRAGRHEGAGRRANVPANNPDRQLDHILTRPAAAWGAMESDLMAIPTTVRWWSICDGAWVQPSVRPACTAARTRSTSSAKASRR